MPVDPVSLGVLGEIQRTSEGCDRGRSLADLDLPIRKWQFVFRAGHYATDYAATHLALQDSARSVDYRWAMEQLINQLFEQRQKVSISIAGVHKQGQIGSKVGADFPGVFTFTTKYPTSGSTWGYSSTWVAVAHVKEVAIVSAESA